MWTTRSFESATGCLQQFSTSWKLFCQKSWSTRREGTRAFLPVIRSRFFSTFLVRLDKSFRQQTSWLWSTLVSPPTKQLFHLWFSCPEFFSHHHFFVIDHSLRVLLSTSPDFYVPLQEPQHFITWCATVTGSAQTQFVESFTQSAMLSLICAKISSTGRRTLTHWLLNFFRYTARLFLKKLPNQHSNSWEVISTFGWT